MRSMQNPQELADFIALLRERGVRRYLEIGARWGMTFDAVMRSLPAGSKGVAVDLPASNSRKSLESICSGLKRDGYDASLCFGGSEVPATIGMVNNRGPYDAILIDGDHSLVAVTRDWENYGSMAPLVAFHDIVGDGQWDGSSKGPVEVPILWQLLRGQNTREFIAPGSKMGIGVVLR